MPTPSLPARLLAITMAAWSLAGAAQPAPKVEPKVVRIVPQADLKILDPVWTSAYITRNHGFMVYDTLFGVDDKGRAQPQMVDRFSASTDLRTWDFTLRPGLAFSDGQPVTSEDVLASLTRWGQRDAFGQKLVQALDRAEALGPTQFRLRFKQPFGMVAEALAKPGPNTLFIMPRRVAQTPADQQIDDFTGSGPFIFKKDEYRSGDKVVYVKNTAYQPRSEPASGTAGGKRVHVDRVEWVILKDAQTQVNALVNGEVDILEYAPAEHFTALRANPKVQLAQVYGPWVTNVHFNHLVAPFDNPKVVRAAMLAINQEALQRAQFPAPELRATCLSIYPCGLPHAATTPDKTTGLTGKPQFEAARKLLKEAGYDGKPVVLMAPTDFSPLNKYPLVYAQLLKEAGFTVDLQAMDWGTLLSRRTNKQSWNAFITAFNGVDVANPAMYTPLTGNGDKGYFGWPTDAQLESLKSRYIATVDEAERRQLAEAIQVRALEAGVFAPIGHGKTMTAMRKGVISDVLQGTLLVGWNLRKQ